MLLLAGSATALATGLGAIPVFLLGERRETCDPSSGALRRGRWGSRRWSACCCRQPTTESRSRSSAARRRGSAFMLCVRRFLGSHEMHVAGMDARQVRTSALVFSVLLVHSAPEGLAIGTAYASDTAGLGLFVILAIALQNMPEGTSTAIPMAAAGFGRKQQFWAAVLTSAPQPVMAVIAFVLVEQVASLLPISFAFAAGAMLALVAFELLPQAVAGRRRRGALLAAVPAQP